MSEMKDEAAIKQLAEKWFEARKSAHFYHGVSEQQFEYYNGLQNGYREAMYVIGEQFGMSRVEVQALYLAVYAKAAA
jgi:hypothetical protein